MCPHAAASAAAQGAEAREGERGGGDWVLLTLITLTLRIPIQRQVRQRKEAEEREGQLRANIKTLMQDLKEFLASNTSDAPPPTSFTTSFTTVYCCICVLIL